jgi:hypothetical protein
MARRSIDEHAILLALGDTIRLDHVGISKERGKRFFSADRLHPVIKNYLDFWKISKAEFCRRFDISPSTLQSILNGNDISDSTLFRLRKSIEEFRYSNIQAEDILTIPGDWRSTDGNDVQKAISRLSITLIELLKSVRASNSVGDKASPIDNIQKAQLIALLESALAELKAPYVDIQRQSGLIAWLKRLGKAGLEKGVEEKIGGVISDVVDAGTELINQIDISYLPNL